MNRILESRKCNLFNQSELLISILILIKELLLMILKYTLEFEKGQAFQTFIDRNQNIKTLAKVTLELKSLLQYLNMILERH